MSAVVKVIPRDERRLRIVAEYDHKTIVYKGDVFALIEKIIQEGWTGTGEFSVNQGRDFYDLRFDFRRKVVDNSSV